MDRDWIRDQIEQHSPEGGGPSSNAAPLVLAAAALSGVGSQIFGRELPQTLGEPQREILRTAAIGAIARWVPQLSSQQLAHLAPLIREAKLPIDLGSFSPEIEAYCTAHRCRTPRPHTIISMFEDEIRRVQCRVCGEVHLYQRSRVAHEKPARPRVIARDTEPHNEELERIVAEHPDNDDAYAVLADWFQSKGAPRGELIALHLRAERDPTVVATATTYLDDHAGALLGPLIDHVKMHDESARDAFTWHRGYIQRAALSYDHDAVELDIGLDDLLEQLLQHPSGRLLQNLAIGLNGKVFENTLDDLIAVIAAERPIALRSLHLGDFVYGEQTEMSWYEVGDLSPLWPCLPRLASLIVQGGAFDLGTIEAPALEHAEFRTGGLSIASATAIAAAMWPRLRHLDVWYGDPNFGGDTTIDHVRLLLRRRDLTALTHLGLRNAAHTDAICTALAETPPILATVRELDLSMGTMTDAGAAVLANAGLRFELLDVGRNFLTPAGVAMLRPIAAMLAHDDQSSDPDRYPSVGE